jgi:hypothetical protein
LAYSGTVPVEAGKLTDPGYYRYRRGGEVHAITPPVLQNFHTYVGIKGADKAGKAEDYKKYVDAVLANTPMALRNLLEMVPNAPGPIPLDEVAGQGYGFQIEMTYRTLLAGFTVIEIPITFTDRTQGESKMSRRIVLEAATHVPRLRKRLGPLPHEAP